jgi:uncharacterized cysteine cluster protein YcgN (CxxCxxCC family)
MARERFWEVKKLEEMSTVEWESLCDGCAKCCLLKLEDDETGEVHYTKVVCRYLDQEQCRCTVYPQRNELVPACVWLTREDIPKFHWLPMTCAYRLLAEGKPLPEWHPLVSGDPDSVHQAGISIKGRALSEEYVHPDGLQEHIIHWVE